LQMRKYMLTDLNEEFEFIPDGFDGFASEHFKQMSKEATGSRLGSRVSYYNDTNSNTGIVEWVETNGFCRTPFPIYGFEGLSDISDFSMKIKSIKKSDISVVEDKMIVLGLFERVGNTTIDTNLRLDVFINHVFNGSIDYINALFGVAGVRHRSNATRSAYILCTLN
jgi:hypothetical protein